MAKGLPRSTRPLTQSFVGGVRADAENVTSVSGGTVALGAPYESRISSVSGGASTDIVQLPAPTVLGQRKAVKFQSRPGSNTIRINAASGDQIVREAHEVGGVTGYTEAVIANVDLVSGNDAALFEYVGVSGSTDTWHLLYTVGSVALS